MKAKCLMNAEVALVLQRKYEQLQQLADDPSAQISQYALCSQWLNRWTKLLPGADIDSPRFLVQGFREVIAICPTLQSLSES